MNEHYNKPEENHQNEDGTASIPHNPPGAARIIISPVPGGTSEAFQSNVPQVQLAPNQLLPVLTESHVNMMAFSQCIGIGLFLQAGRVVYLAGPGLGFLSYIIAGTVLWSSAACLGEMCALFPVKGPIIEFPMRFLDKSLGYTAGWITWFSWVIIIALELVAIVHMFQFHYPPDLLQQAGYPDSSLDFDPAVSPVLLIACFWVIMLSVNYLPARHLGQLEFVFGAIKMAYLSLLIVFNVALHILRPADREAFWTYNSPFSFAAQNFTLPDGAVVEGDAGRVLGVWSALTTSLFGLVGFETIAITAAENKDWLGQETVKLATRKTVLRILLLYSLATFAAGLNVPYTYPLLASREALSISHGQTSIFVIAPVLGRLPRAWPLLFNHFVIFTATTAGTMAVYNASRTLHALAGMRDAWPSWPWAQALRRRLVGTSSYGVPRQSVFVSCLFGMLGFVGQNRDSTEVLARIVRASLVAMLITYGLVSASYIQFYKRLRMASEGRDPAIIDMDMETDNPRRRLYDREDVGYPFKSRGQPFSAYYSTAACTAFVILNGWSTLVGDAINWHDFFGCYVSLIIMILIMVMYQIKFSGWNPLNWRLGSPSYEMQKPPPRSVPPPGPGAGVGGSRPGVLSLPRPDDLFHWGNVKELFRWLWVWSRV